VRQCVGASVTKEPPWLPFLFVIVILCVLCASVVQFGAV